MIHIFVFRAGEIPGSLGEGGMQVWCRSDLMIRLIHGMKLDLLMLMLTTVSVVESPHKGVTQSRV